MPASITIMNAASPERAESLRRLLEGKTYMDLRVGFAPIGGSFDVVVETSYTNLTEELHGMVMDLMAGAICDMGSPQVQKALAVGIDRLNDGDPRDIKVALRAERAVFKNYGLLRAGTGMYPKEQATRGWACPNDTDNAVEVWINGAGKWTTGSVDLAPGTAIYWDEGCFELLLRTPA